MPRAAASHMSLAQQVSIVLEKQDVIGHGIDKVSNLIQLGL